MSAVEGWLELQSKLAEVTAERARLQEQNASLLGEVAGLREALEESRQAIGSLPEDALGEGWYVITLPDGEPGQEPYPLRDELLDEINRALSGSEAGKLAGDVLRAAVKETDCYDARHHCLGPSEEIDRLWDELELARDDTMAAVRALISAFPWWPRKEGEDG